MAASPVPSLPLPPGCIFRPRGKELILHYLLPKAIGGSVTPGFVADGVDVFSSPPNALPFSHRHRRPHGEVWGYFFGARPVGERAPAPAPGGCWFPYGREKVFRCLGSGREPPVAFAFRRRFQYHIALLQQGGGDGMGVGFYYVWAWTPWLMTEFRLNKGEAGFRRAPLGPMANMDCVVRKVFTKPAVPPLPYYPTADDESTASNYPGPDDEAG